MTDDERTAALAEALRQAKSAGLLPERSLADELLGLAILRAIPDEDQDGDE